MRQKLVMMMANEDEWLAWESQKESYRQNIGRWMAELENHPVAEYREIGKLLKQAVDIWDNLLEHNIPAVVGQERFETYRRSLPHIVQYLAHRIFQLARLSGLEHVKSCISCGKYFYAYKSKSRFCSPRCYSIYELFLRPMNSLFELTRENFMPNMWRECIICGNKASRWMKTSAGGWKFDWVHSIKSPHIDYLRESFDEYRVTCMSPFCQWAATNLRKLRKAESLKEGIEQRKKRWQGWIAKVQSPNYTPSVSLLKAMLEAIAESIERALVVHATFYIIWNGQPPQRYILFNDTQKLRRAALAAMFVPLNPPNYRHFFFEFMRSLIDRVPLWLEVLTQTWSNAITNPEVTLFYPSSSEISVFSEPFAEALTVLDTTPVVNLSNEHLPDPSLKSWSEAEEALYKAVMGFVQTNRPRLQEIVKIAHEKP